MSQVKFRLHNTDCRKNATEVIINKLYKEVEKHVTVNKFIFSSQELIINKEPKTYGTQCEIFQCTLIPQ